MSPENLRLRFFGVSRRSAELAADRACAAPRPGHRALLAERTGQVIGLAGLGGTATEVLADHAARLAPLTDHDVHDLITTQRCAPLLFGPQGSGPVDLQALEQLLHRLSRMASDLPQLAEADFNPVLAAPGGVTVLDARVRLLPRRPQDPYLRRLR
ncbi:acetate--CoA ligase family protein [Streptomyces sp. NBC_01597]|uniref:acetate--CoA ligase family protein n=1 Tax=Streptomyces sp. NBC_01597 TaxID=2975891 RepID=UPI00386AC592